LEEGGWKTAAVARKGLSDVSVAALEAQGSTHLEEEEVPAEKEAVAADEAAATAQSADELVKFGHAKDLSILFVHGPYAQTKKFNLAVRNFPGIDVISVEDLAAYDVLKRKWTIMDVESLEYLAERSGDLELLEMEEEELEASAAEPVSTPSA
jgi:ribosomal protein L4